MNIKNTQNTFLKLTLLLFSLAVTGCKEEMYSNLSESEANQMLALLLSEGIDAEKQSINGKSITLKVEGSQFSSAVELLKQNGYPKQEFATVEQLFPQDGLVSTPTQEKARFEYAISQSLAKTLNQIDGVISARVHLMIPAETRMKTKQPSSAAVFVKHSQEAEISQLTPQIKSLVQSSIEGLDYNNVKVILVESSTPPPIVIKTEDSSLAAYLYIAILILIVISIAIACYAFFSIRKLKSKNLEMLENVVQESTS
ncbi:type III secretion system inner membrane ring lipoprotein SctJ [Vibrio aquimaris]|uniref:Lipoprotein n=1 Tax=Vibrio aquimaris TaxID=2587862 RepID=A0A5P9CN50_9VIBR|nr:type III secretion inner membrane ring lipoprotein SctJ [Vibrio aquimaris]QFT27719.1 Yop proteins translocation lipoprotein J precursor [Vibrio aquimaris]